MSTHVEVLQGLLRRPDVDAATLDAISQLLGTTPIAPTVVLKLAGMVQPKARPRAVLQAGRLIMITEPKYRQWKSQAVKAFKLGYVGTPFRVGCISVILYGKHGRGADTDNVVGALMDALVQAKVLVEDNMKQVPRNFVTLEYSDEEPWVQIELIQPEVGVKLPGKSMTYISAIAG